MDDILKEVHCTDAKDFISKFSYGGEYFHLRTDNFIFRGEPSDQYSLIPSSLREENRTKIEEIIRNLAPEFSKDNFDLSQEYNQITSEYALLNVFFQKCDYNGLYIPEINDLRLLRGHYTYLATEMENIDVWLPLKYIELAGLAQHYGIYTRLLDWTQDLNVALYFAVSGYMLNKTTENPDNHPKNIVIWALNTEIVVNNKSDMPGLKITVPKYNSNPNLCAQKGVFTLWQTHKNNKNLTDRTPLNKLIEENPKLLGNVKSGNPLYKIYIPTQDYQGLKTHLETSGYDSSRLFPGYRGVAKSLLRNI